MNRDIIRSKAGPIGHESCTCLGEDLHLVHLRVGLIRVYHGPGKRNLGTLVQRADDLALWVGHLDHPVCPDTLQNQLEFLLRRSGVLNG